MFWFGLIFVVVVLVAIAALFKAWDYYTDSEHFEWLCAQKSMALVGKERRITALKYALRDAQAESATAEALVLDKDAELNELDEKLRQALQAEADAVGWMDHWKAAWDKEKKETPEWYRMMLLEQQGTIKDLQWLNQKLSEGNVILHNDKAKLSEEQRELAIKLKWLREELDTIKADKAARDKAYYFGQMGCAFDDNYTTETTDGTECPGANVPGCQGAGVVEHE